MIFIKKNIDKLVQDQFLQPVKDHPYDGKIMPCFFFQTRKKKFICQKSENMRLRVLKYTGTHVLGFMIIKFSFCVFEEKKHVFYFFKIFKEN